MLSIIKSLCIIPGNFSGSDSCRLEGERREGESGGTWGRSPADPGRRTAVPLLPVPQTGFPLLNRFYLPGPVAVVDPFVKWLAVTWLFRLHLPVPLATLLSRRHWIK